MPNTVIIDGNEAAASVAHRASEVIAIYPITPSSTMGELADEWSAAGRTNLWNTVPEVIEMQSEGGAAGAVHGALQGGALATTFTASQGLLLMIPNMYKIAGELLPFVMHVSARTLATHALSIFGDHSDVMACRQTGFAMLASGSVQEAHDLAAVAHAATLASRVPFLHFFDGFRTSHELTRIELLEDEDLRALLDERLIAENRRRALTPDHPVLRGTAQNPDVFFQAREAANSFYVETPALVQRAMDALAARVGRQYHLFDYHGHPEAEQVIVVIGSAAEVTHEAVDWMNARGRKVGVLKVRLYRPFSIADFLQALPRGCKQLAVLDRTKEPGAIGEPLYLDVVAALRESSRDDVEVIGGRYGLSSKEFTPAMVVGVFDELARPSASRRRHFTVGIVDDLTRLSIDYDTSLDIEPSSVTRCLFFGLGADGTVGANKNSIKIIGEETDFHPQGYFVYDSKKSGAVTVSHLRFGPHHLRSSYLVQHATFIGCHQFGFLERMDVLAQAAQGAVFLLNSPYSKDEVWARLPREVQQHLIEKKIHFYVIDALKVAQATGMKGRINTVMQTCFFAISGVLPREEAIAAIKKGVQKTYGKKGQAVVERNYEAIDQTLANLQEVVVPGAVSATFAIPALVPEIAPDFVKRVLSVMMAGKGDLLPVSAFPVDGTFPVGTARWEKRNIATELPVWDEALCIQCNKCAMVCPHAAIRPKVYERPLDDAPPTFKSTAFRGTEWKDARYSLQVAPADCTGCTICTVVCPAKDKADPQRKALRMMPHDPLQAAEAENFDFFLKLPEADRTKVRLDVKGAQLLQPLFEFSGACSGCGETPYVKLITQLYGDRMIIANATGCSSIYGGNLPTVPYCTDLAGRGPAWANSLFEDNAEFGLGLRLAADKHEHFARELLTALGDALPGELVAGLLRGAQGDEKGIAAQRARVEQLKAVLRSLERAEAKRLLQLADYLVKKSVWIVGGDGWAYDIGYGGLDHVLASGRKVNILVLDTEVYSNTGGQASKSTPLAAAAKFATGGKTRPKKDLGMLAMTYGNVYVARVAFGAKDAQTLTALQEAESFPGTSLVIGYASCIAHGIDLGSGLSQQKLAVDTGYWPLYRYDPRRVQQGVSAFKLDSSPPKVDVAEYMKTENRFRMVEQQGPERYAELVDLARAQVKDIFRTYAELERRTP